VKRGDVDEVRLYDLSLMEREAISYQFMIWLTSRQPFLGIDDLSDKYVKTELPSDDDEDEQLGQTEKYMNVM
jgi:hypothetical protein